MLNVRSAASAATALIASLAFAASAGAAPGDFDQAYGLGGVAIGPQLSFTDISSTATPDGKAIVGNRTNSPQWKVIRFTTAGGLDTSFSGDGIFTGVFPGVSTAQADVGVKTDGSVVTIGRADSQVAYGLTASDGSTLSSGSQNLGAGCEGSGITGTPDNKVVALANCSGGVALIMRYSTGFVDFDSTFGFGGQNGTGSGAGKLNAVAVQPDLKPVAVGSLDPPSGPDQFRVIRYPSATPGVLDSSFGASATGRTYVPIGTGNAVARAVAIAPDGKILVAGEADVGGTVRAALIRLTDDGELDTTFGEGGKALIKGTSASSFSGVTVQPNGKTIAVGNEGVLPVVMRFTQTGELDSTFAAGGKQTGMSGDTANVSLTSDGKILVGGSTRISGVLHVSAFRLLGGEVPGGDGTNGAKPRAKIKSPSRSKLKARKFKSISGTATDATKVQIAVLKTDKKLLKKRKRCSQLSSPKAKFKKVKAVKKKCAPVEWLNATGASSWKFKLKKKLPVARYTIYVRAIGAGGTSTPIKKSLKLTR